MALMMALMMALPMMALRMAWGMLCNVGHATRYKGKRVSET